MAIQNLQIQFDKIYFYFKTTCEPFDFLDWNGKVLFIWKGDNIIESYLLKDLRKLIFN